MWSYTPTILPRNIEIATFKDMYYITLAHQFLLSRTHSIQLISFQGRILITLCQHIGLYLERHTVLQIL
jgi:hypothetical protein